MYERKIKILFLDESFPKDIDITVVAGFFIDSSKIFYLENEIKKILNEFSLNNLNDLKDKKLDINTRKEINNKIANLLKECESKILCAIILNKDSRIKSHGKDYVFSEILNAIRFVLERFVMNLSDDEKGIVFYDETENLGFLNKILKNERTIIHKRVTYIGQITSKIDLTQKIYCILHLSDDDSLSIKIADIIAGSIQVAIKNLLKKRKIDTLKEDIENLNHYFYGLNPYWGLFPREKNTNRISGYGIKIW